LWWQSVTASVSTKTISFSGIPAPGIKSLRTGGADWLRLPDGAFVASIIVQWGDVPGKRASITSFRSTDGGFSWVYAGSIAKADDAAVPSNEGPNENSLALLSNGTIICVMRLDAGDAGRCKYTQATHDFRPNLSGGISDGLLVFNRP